MEPPQRRHDLHPMSFGTVFCAFALVALLAFVGCRDLGVLSPSPTPPPPDLTPDQRTIQLNVVLGPQGSVLAFVPVYINGEGPFSFAIDTGASQTLIDAAIAARLGLEPEGDSRPITGVVAAAQAGVIRIDQWSLGGTPLAPREVLSLELPRMNGKFQWHGLLGSDVLSSYGSVTIDYEQSILILGPSLEPASQP